MMPASGRKSKQAVERECGHGGVGGTHKGGPLMVVFVHLTPQLYAQTKTKGEKKIPQVRAD